MGAFHLPTDLATELCRRLGVPWPAGPAQIDPLYRAWCAAVPFDNVAKEVAVAEGRVPPGDDPVEVVERFLDTGLGGTCWAHVASLAGLLTTAGARITVGLDRMTRSDDLVDFHSFVVIHDGGERRILDPVWVSGAPLPLRAGAAGTHPVIRTGLDAGDRDGHGAGGGRLWHWAVTPQGDRLRYAQLSTVLDRDDVRAFCAVSARFSGIPAGTMTLRRTTAEETVSLRGPARGDERPVLTLRRRDARGAHEERFADPDAAFAAFGCTPRARRLAERAGLLAP